MKKRVLPILLAALFAAAGLWAAEAGDGAMDMVVVLDTSSSMFSARDSVTDYAIGPLIADFLRAGDTFHLISFASAPRVELSRKVTERGDLEAVVSRLLLLYPLDPYSDVAAALDYTASYVADLPEGRTKLVVFISDGEHAPAPSSPNYGLSADVLTARIQEAGDRFRGQGWAFYFLKVPFTGEHPLTPLRSSSAVPSPSGASSAGKGSSGSASTSSSAAGAAAAGPAAAAGAPSGPGGLEQGGAAETAGSRSGTSEAPGEAKNPDGSPSTEGSDAGKAPYDVTGAVSDAVGTEPVPLKTGTETSGDGTAETTGAVGGESFMGIVATYPRDLGTKARRFAVPLKVRNPASHSVYLETLAVEVDGVDRMAGKGFLSLDPRQEGTLTLRIELPESVPDGQRTIELRPVLAGSVRLLPPSSSILLTVKSGGMVSVFGTALPVLLFALAVLAAACVVIFGALALRRMHAAPARAVGDAVAGSSAVARRDDEARDDGTAVTGRPAEGASRRASGTLAGTGTGTIRPNGVVPASVKSGSGLLAAAAASKAADFRAMGNAPDLERYKDRGSADAERALAAFAGGRSVQPPAEEQRRAGADLVAPPPAAPYKVVRENARIMLSLYVEDQNTAIGRRNVHLLKAGSSLSLGGGRSDDFLVFLVRVPHRIAEIRYDGEVCSLIPRRPDLFAVTGNEIVADCVGKTIELVSEKGYQLKIRFDRFEDPLSRLNRFLHSIDVPGTTARN